MKTHTVIKIGAVGLVLRLAVMPLAAFGQDTYTTPYTFTTIAGKAVVDGNADGMGNAARFAIPSGVAVDSAGNVYVADDYNCTIRKVTPVGTNWVVTTLAGLGGVDASGNPLHPGSADGTNSAARFNHPSGVAVDTHGNVYVSDTKNNLIRQVTPVGTNWVVTTLAGKPGGSGSADGMGNTARFYNPSSVAVDSAGNVYVTDELNFTIRKLTPVGTNWVVTTLAGKPGSYGSADGMGSAARFNYSWGLAVDGSGNLYVADQKNCAVRKVAPLGTNWVVTTVAGMGGVNASGQPLHIGSADGMGSAARFSYPDGVAVDSAGNVYVADQVSQTIRKVTPVGTNWVVTTLAGKASSSGSADGTGSAARFNAPTGVAVDNVGNVYVGDWSNHTIRKGYPALVIASAEATFGFNDGQFGFDLTGPAGKAVVVEASTDLVSWLPLLTNTLTGALQFRDPESGVDSHRFYRIRTP